MQTNQDLQNQGGLENDKIVRFSSLKSGNLRFKDYVGLGCQTSYHEIPYFFLFADIDSNDEELLRLTQQLFARHELGFYTYGTSKGYHVVSPMLLNIHEWDNARKQLSDILDNYYRNLVIRIERKKGDSNHIEWDNFNLRFRHLESQTFHNLIKARFGKYATAPNAVKSKLFFTHYTQIRHE